MSRTAQLLRTPVAWTVIAFLGMALVGAAALGAAATRDERSTAFSADVPPAQPVATLSRGTVACQGPIAVTGPIRGVTVWTARQTGAGLALSATVRNARSGARLARADLRPSSSQPAATLTAVGGSLDHTISAGDISVCVRASGGQHAQLMGATAGARSGALTGRQRMAAALLFESPHPASLLSLMPTVFRRAALFHPAWIGAWTFWVLVVGLLAATGLVLASLARAATVDGASEG